MKVSSKISIIATATTLALAGTAFAAWEFNKAATKDVTSNVTITKDASAGELTLSPETWYLTLDQDFIGWTSSSHADDENAISDGLTEVTVTYTGSAKSNNVSDVTLGASFTAITAPLSTYISITGGSLGTPTATGNVKEAVYTLPTVAWVAKPTTQADFDAMKAALASATVSFSFTATIA